MIEEEIWKSITGWEDIYEVSNFGQIRSVDRERRAKNGSFRLCKGKILKGYINAFGYKALHLSKPGQKTKGHFFHTLVTYEFLGERPLGYQVNHIDGDKLNNNINNLEYTTRSENIKHAFRLGLKKGLNGEDNPACTKLNSEKALKISQYPHDYSISKICEEVGCDKRDVHSIRRGDTWSHITKIPKKPIGCGHPYGIDNGSVKLTEDEVIEIFTSSVLSGELAKKFNVERSTIKRIRNGRSWQRLTSSLDIVKNKETTNE